MSDSTSAGSGTRGGDPNGGYFASSGTPSPYGAAPSQFGGAPSPYAGAPQPAPFGAPVATYSTSAYAMTPPPAKKSALPKVLGVVGVLALLVVAFFGWNVYQHNRPIELPSTLAGLSMNTSPEVEQAVKSMEQGLSKDNPGIATTAAVYGKAPKVVVVGAGRGQEDVDADLRDNAPGAVTNVGASKCSSVNGGAMCIRSEPGMTVVVLEVGGTPATAAGLVDLLWNQI
jgi:hypothetical protein